MKYILVNQSSKHAYKVAANDVEKNSSLAVEVTDELASQLESSTENLFLIDGALKTLMQKHVIENIDVFKNRVRSKRNILLINSDWTQLSDSPLDADKVSEWATYRQALRDLTDNLDENGDVTFPTAP